MTMVLPGTRIGQSVEALMAECQTRNDQSLTERALEWKSGRPGSKVVGCFPVYAPVELFYGMGCLPLGVLGGGHKVELQHADARFQSFVCSISKTTLELGLQKQLGGLDALMFESICDVARNLSSVFKRNFPTLHVEYIHLPQNMASAGVVDYLVGEYQRVAANLERQLGVLYSAEGLRKSLVAFNESRRAWRALYDLRRQSPHLISAVELYTASRAGTRLPPEEHADLLRAFKAAAERRTTKGKDRIRVVVEGAFCEQPPVDLIALLEEAGCYVVDDDYLLGWRWFMEDIPTTGDPLRALAESYITRSQYSSVRHDQGHNRNQGLLDKVKAANAQAVVFMPAKFCEPALFDYALFRQALEVNKIPHLMLEFEEKMWTFERARGEIETFVESLLFD